MTISLSRQQSKKSEATAVFLFKHFLKVVVYPC